MKAITFHGTRALQYTQVADPAIEAPNDVIIQTSLCAICGSDLHVYRGVEQGCDHGTVMGHEFTGVIVEAGSGVKKFTKGQRVVSPFSTSCGNCFFCKIGLTARCTQSQLFGWRENGAGLQGAQAQFVRVPMADTTLLPVPGDLTEEQALLTGDVIATGYFCALQAEVKNDGTYAVIGCGVVGLMATLASLEMGAGKVFAIDLSEERLARAASLGAIPINPSTTNAQETIRDHNKGIGVDGAMEAVGSGASLQLACDVLRPGGILSMVGVCNDQQFPFSPVQAYNKNLTYKVGRCPAYALNAQAINIARKYGQQISSLITHRMNLSEAVGAYEIFDAKKENCLKVVLKP